MALCLTALMPSLEGLDDRSPSLNGQMKLTEPGCLFILIFTLHKFCPLPYQYDVVYFQNLRIEKQL